MVVIIQWPKPTHCLIVFLQIRFCANKIKFYCRCSKVSKEKLQIRVKKENECSVTMIILVNRYKKATI